MQMEAKGPPGANLRGTAGASTGPAVKADDEWTAMVEGMRTLATGSEVPITCAIVASFACVRDA